MRWPREATGLVVVGVCIAGGVFAAAPADRGRTGEQVYQHVCIACHRDGVSRAPRFRDADAWRPRIAKGQERLVTSAIKGTYMMPPRGASPDLSDVEVARAVAYMVNAAGGSFTEP